MYVWLIGEMKNVYKILIRSSDGKIPGPEDTEDLGVDGRIVFKKY
jgi:hypothetical protein